jgi:ERCC4-type nuclease
MTEPCLFCTNEPNDADLVRTLGLSAVAVPLFTDCCFSSVDEKLVAIERKKIGDMASCVLSGRFLSQMQKCKSAEADYLVLILEGAMRSNPDDGLLEVPTWGINIRTGRRAEIWTPVKPTMMHSRITQYLLELQLLAGILVFQTRDVQQTAAVILSLYTFFQKPMDAHSSLKQFYTERPPQVTLVRPGLVKRVAKELDGVGWTRAGDVAEHFGSVQEMINAPESEWKKVPGIGKRIAKSIVLSVSGKRA